VGDQIKLGSLFAGIGGFDLGFERAGFETVWQVEINEWCRKVLAKNFPRAERYGDIRECGAHNLKRVDVLVGGFPCQDISNAGLRAGIEGERSGLWGEYARIIGELRPSFVLVENVGALLSSKGWSEESNDKCVCGWPYRRRGVHHHSSSGDDVVLGADRCGYVGQRDALLDEVEGFVRGKDPEDARENGEVGGGIRLGAVRQGDRSISAGSIPILDSQSRASTICAVASRPYSEFAAGEEGCGGMDFRSPRGGDVHPRSSDGTESQGSGDGEFDGLDCPSCGREVADTTTRPVFVSAMGRVLGDLAALGYDAEWEVVSAADVGAPHLRERVWILAYPSRRKADGECREPAGFGMHRWVAMGTGTEAARSQDGQTGDYDANGCREVAYAACELLNRSWNLTEQARRCESADRSEDVPHAGVKHGGQGWTGRPSGNCADGQGERKETLADTSGAGREELDAAAVAVAERFDTGCAAARGAEAWWAVEPDVCGMDDGLPQRLDGGLDASSGLGTEGSASEGFERLMRRVWCDLAAGIAPQGRGTDEQLSGELSYALSKVSHETALGHRKEGLENASRYVQRMRQACEAIGVVRNPSEPLLEAWLSLSGEEKDRCHLASCGRTDWAAGEWLGVPRVAHGIPRRVDRLRGLGNAVVPQIPELYAKRIKRLLEATNG
jgi:site-specific DNA-cytosine methylase